MDSAVGRRGLSKDSAVGREKACRPHSLSTGCCRELLILPRPRLMRCLEEEIARVDIHKGDDRQDGQESGDGGLGDRVGELRTRSDGRCREEREKTDRGSSRGSTHR